MGACILSPSSHNFWGIVLSPKTPQNQWRPCCGITSLFWPFHFVKSCLISIWDVLTFISCVTRSRERNRAELFFWHLWLYREHTRIATNLIFVHIVVLPERLVAHILVLKPPEREAYELWQSKTGVSGTQRNGGSQWGPFGWTFVHIETRRKCF